ncbi:hypothetical protein J2129_001868 [Methanofollis sp. W23]|uniref:hypothetical protein n=1 Tax=Methanofollis sp. W23 TaxID=2817849 RepID=UPI001AEB0A4B|nr:hypothetical protein [Methanofollis sp. W23]MBP2146414.1 hypothetical protein [Methanofollis sp. W23]
METEKINFWIKDGYFHLSYGGISLTQAKDGYDQIMDFCDYLIVMIHEECIPKLLRGETCKIDLLDDPHTLIFVSKGDMVTIIFETEVTEWFEPRKEFTAPLEEWFRAVQEVTLDFIQQMQADKEETYVMIPVSTLIEDYQTTKKLLQNAGYLIES